MALPLTSPLTLTLSGCAVQPAPHASLRQEVQSVAPARWRATTPQAETALEPWWAAFGDPTMHRLTASVLKDNLDVRGAAERVKQAEAIAIEQRATLLP